MANKKITLLTILIKKEFVYWNRMKNLFSKMDDIGSKFISYPIIVVTVSVFHYMFAGMHFMFEGFLFLTNNNQFKNNLQRLNNKYR